MRTLQIRVLALISVFLLASLPTSVSASTLQLVVAEDKTTGYQRSAFKHWIDADKNGCNTRAEVLIAEAIVKPKIGPKCKLTGGKWVSAYDGKTITNASLLDVDHMVPLAEAWRSGAWKWSDAQRQAFANDLENSEALRAVTLSTNRSKGDKDPANWMPEINFCNYLRNWVSIKIKYSLAFDSKEESYVQENWNACNSKMNLEIPMPKTPVAIVESSTTESFTWVQINVTPYEYIPGKNTQMTGHIDESVYGSSVLECFYNSKTGKNKFANFYPIFNDTASIFCKVKNNSVFIFYTEAQQIYINKLINETKSEILTVKVGLPPTPAPSATAQNLVVSPGAFCSPAGATGLARSGVTHTCKASSTDLSNRWRQ